jgi:hypothetical protein
MEEKLSIHTPGSVKRDGENKKSEASNKKNERTRGVRRREINAV